MCVSLHTLTSTNGRFTRNKPLFVASIRELILFDGISIPFWACRYHENNSTFKAETRVPDIERVSTVYLFVDTLLM